MSIQFLQNYLNVKPQQNFGLKLVKNNSLPSITKLLHDTVSFSGNVNKEEWTNGVSEATLEELKGAVNEIVNDNLEGKKLLGKGADGEVYKIDNISGYPNGVAVKISHVSTVSQVGEMQRVGKDFKNEREILKALPDSIANTQHIIGYVTVGGRNVLLTTIVKGKSPDPASNPFDEKNLALLLDTLSELDKGGILHRDLKKENILIDKEKNTVGLIDFGESVKIDLEDVDFNEKEHHFPRFMMPSNIRNFEDTCLAPYLNELSKTDSDKAKELFTQYLSIRAEKVHKPAYEYLKSHLEENSSNLDPEQLTELTKALRFEEIQAKLLAKPTPEIIDLELQKMQTTYASELAYKNEVLLLNPLANMTLKMWAVINAKRLEGKVNQLEARPNDLETKEYLSTVKDIAKFRQAKIIEWSKGLFGWLMNCSEKDLNESNEGEKSIQQQFMKNGINDFEIPDLTSKLSIMA